MGISSLPTGVTAAFSPTQVVPGTSSAQVTLSLATSASLVRLEQRQPRAVILWALLVLPMAFVLRRRRLQAWSICLMTILLATATGCGDRVLPASSQPNLTFSFTVAGTGTNLAGNVVMHSLPITLIVQ
jgi:hypothetical protein